MHRAFSLIELIPEWMNPADVTSITRSLDDYLGRYSEIREVALYLEKNVSGQELPVLRRLEGLYLEVSAFARLRDAIELEVLTRFPRKRLEFFKDKLNFKIPGYGEFSPHQDSGGGWERYAPYFITAGVALDPCDLQSGPLEVAEMYHQPRQLQPRSTLDNLRYIPVTMKTGDLCIFGSYVPHRSLPSCAAQVRRIYYCTFSCCGIEGASARYLQDKALADPPARDIKVAGIAVSEYLRLVRRAP